MTIRQAFPKDAAEICEIINPIIQDTLTTFTTRLRNPEETRLEIEQRGAAFMVAEEAEKVIGFASFGPFRAGPGYAHSKELSIHLASHAQGQGHGRQLMRSLELIAVRNSVHVLIAAISSANPGAVEFHRKQGFEQVGHMPNVGFKHGRWLDLILMQKRLLP
mgnify:CR=1 FL=1